MADKPLVGQTVYLVNRWGQGSDCIVTDVGRKWARIAPVGADGSPSGRGHQRFDWTDERWPVDGGRYTSEDSVWLSKQDHSDAVRADLMWTKLVRRLHGRRPDCTAERIMQAAQLLGIDMEESNG